jgi:hypothetical protein
MKNTVLVEKEIQRSPDAIKVELFKVLTNIESAEAASDKGFIELGIMLDKIKADKLWEKWAYSGYNDFVKKIAEKYPRTGRTKLYSCARIAEQLLPLADEADVVDMGISKASKLAAAVKKSDGKKPTDSLLAKARDPKVTVEQFDQQVAEEYEFKNDFEEGTWVDLSGVFMSEPEKEEFQRAIKTACLDDPPLPQILDRWNDNKAAHLRKEILQRWIMSYLAEKEKIVNDGQK